MSCEPNNTPPPTPAPVMPRCDIVLLDGTFINATIVVEDGCITDVQAGAMQVYTPDPCCPLSSGNENGGTGVDGPQGPPGVNATVSAGSVTSLPSGSTPTVTNVGTPTAAIFNFGIPRGQNGVDAGGATTGVTDTSAGIEIVAGVIKTIPVQWPPVMYILATPPSTPGVTLMATEDPLTGIVTLTLDMAAFVTDLVTDFQTQLDTVQLQMSALQTQVISLQEAVLACCGSAVLDIDGNGTPDPGGTPGVSPPPPITPN